jgi:hypothetical protein
MPLHLKIAAWHDDRDRENDDLVLPFEIGDVQTVVHGTNAKASATQETGFVWRPLATVAVKHGGTSCEGV